MSLTEIEEKALNPHALNDGPHVSYMVRRETHSSRAITSVIVALVISVLSIYLFTEGLLAMLGKKPLLANWSTMVNKLIDLPHQLPTAALVAIGVIFCLIALILLCKALLPATLGRHSIKDNRVAYVVDDSVIASSVSRYVRQHAGLPDGQVKTSVSGKKITATITPTSGLLLDTADIEKHLVPHIESYQLTPAPRTDITVTKDGVVAK